MELKKQLKESIIAAQANIVETQRRIKEMEDDGEIEIYESEKAHYNELLSNLETLQQAVKEAKALLATAQKLDDRCIFI